MNPGLFTLFGEVVFLDSITQGIAADPQKFGRLYLVPSGLGECFLDEKFLDFFQETGMESPPPEPKKIGKEGVEHFG